MATITQDMNIQQGNRLANSGSLLICHATKTALVLVVLGMTGDFEVGWWVDETELERPKDVLLILAIIEEQ